MKKKDETEKKRCLNNKIKQKNGQFEIIQIACNLAEIFRLDTIKKGDMKTQPDL